VLIRVGSRGSRLALTQAELASARLRAPGIEIALVPITTAGDRDRTKPFGEIGARGVFVKELEEALLELEPRAARDETRVFSRRIEPADQIAARLELAGPRGERGGVDLRGDSSAAAFTGRLRRQAVEQRGDESAGAALERALGPDRAG